jgi:glycosyltransferase involved in cell wall biosynthesis
MPTAMHVLIFSPRGGSSQVVRSLARTLPLAPGGWRVKVVTGSLGPPGAPENAATFFGDVTDLVPVPYDEAARSTAPQAAWIPMHPSYEERPGAPDRVFAALDDATAEYLISAWERILGAEGVLDDVTIAHLHHLTPAHAAIARLAPQLPRVTHLHGTELLMLEAIERGAAWPYGMAWRERMREWAHASTWLIAATESAAGDAVRLLGVPRERIAVIANGVDPTLFAPRRSSPSVRRAHWRRWLIEDPRGWTPVDQHPGSVRYEPADLAPIEAPGAMIVLFVGRFTAVKRAALLVRAHAQAQARLAQPVPLIFIGGAQGEWEGEHPADAAKASPFRDEIFLAGWREQDELPAALAAADLLAVPSVAERFGQVYVEAMAMGVPPIACNVYGPPTFIDANPRSPFRAGWLVPPDDEAALADALVAAVSNPTERALRAVNGRRGVVAGSMTWPRIAAQIVDLYEQARTSARGATT